MRRLRSGGFLDGGALERAGAAAMSRITGDEHAAAPVAQTMATASAMPAHHAPDLKPAPPRTR